MTPKQASRQWQRDEEFRQSVIRKALLLGFACEEDNDLSQHMPAGELCRFSFRHWNEKANMTYVHTGYASIYAAAWDYLRLLKIPPEVIGDFRG